MTNNSNTANSTTRFLESLVYNDSINTLNTSAITNQSSPIFEKGTNVTQPASISGSPFRISIGGRANGTSPVLGLNKEGYDDDDDDNGEIKVTLIIVRVLGYKFPIDIQHLHLYAPFHSIYPGSQLKAVK